ncbi:hypothetical protein, partial [Micromonospora sp. KC207]|uniref:hypothetical protein n=1 Tax=Micromonospora sp. KC207 TaxID=2530377 RepID=UPI001FB67552
MGVRADGDSPHRAGSAGEAEARTVGRGGTAGVCGAGLGSSAGSGSAADLVSTVGAFTVGGFRGGAFTVGGFRGGAFTVRPGIAVGLGPAEGSALAVGRG